MDRPYPSRSSTLFVLCSIELFIILYLPAVGQIRGKGSCRMGLAMLVFITNSVAVLTAVQRFDRLPNGVFT